MKKQDVNMLISGWQENGVISPDQANHLRHDVSEFTSKKAGDKFITAVMYMGATALSLGVLLIIASNWDGFSKGIKLLLTLLMPVLPLSFAYWQMVMKESVRALGRAAGILGLALVGGSLALIGQIYNLEPNMVSFLSSWAVLTLPFVFIFKQRENVVFSAVMIGAALLFTVFDFLENADIDDGVAVLLVTISALVYSYVLYRLGTILRNNGSWSTSSRLLRIGGGYVAIVVLFITTFEEYAETLVDASYRDPGNSIAISIILNLFFIGFLVFAILRALKFEEYTFAFTVVRVFGVYLLVKYFVLFFTMIDTGVFFMVGGVLFILGAWMLEKRRERLISYMRNVHNERISN